MLIRPKNPSFHTEELSPLEL